MYIVAILSADLGVFFSDFSASSQLFRLSQYVFRGRHRRH